MKNRVTPDHFTELLNEYLSHMQDYVTEMRIEGDENGYWLVAPDLSPTARSALLKSVHDQVAEHYAI
jgi:hypothetical protein